MTFHVHFTVDVLSSVGLREDDISNLNATVVEGPSGSQAFALTGPLSAPTTGPAWEAIQTEFPSSFSVFVVFDSSMYSGTIFLLGEDQLRISVDNGTGVQILLIALPGVNETVEVEIPPPPDGFTFCSFGVAVQQMTVTVVLDGSESITELPNLPKSLNLSMSTVQIFDEGTVVCFYTSMLNFPVLLIMFSGILL